MKRLYPSQKDKKIAGICGGLDEMFSVAPEFSCINWLVRFKSACALTIVTIMLGCVATSDQIKGMNEMQTQIEAKVEKLSKDMEELKSGVKGIEQDNTRLKERLYKLEKNEGFSGLPSTKSPDIQYQLAESYYREGKFEEAVLQFQSFIDTSPKDSRVPISYLKQGLSLINLGRKEEAKFFLQTLIDKFPESEEAKKAKEKLKELSRRG